MKIVTAQGDVAIFRFFRPGAGRVHLIGGFNQSAAQACPTRYCENGQRIEDKHGSFEKSMDKKTITQC